MSIIRLSYELAYFEARLAARMRLTPKEWARVGSLRQLLARDPARGRRAHRRFAVDVAGVVKAGSAGLEVAVEEISAGGCRIRSPLSFSPGEKLKLSIELRHSTFVFGCEVVRTARSAGQALLGLRFSGIPLELRRFRTRPPSLLDTLQSRAG